MSTRKTTERLKKSKQHRTAYVASQINVGIPFQIRALRKQRKWDQKTLAMRAEMAQPRISAMENAGYSSFTLETLRRIASAFDVALIVRFAPFSELIRWADRFSPDNFGVPSFEEELEQVESASGNVLAFNYLSTARETRSGMIHDRIVDEYVLLKRHMVGGKFAEQQDTTALIRSAA